MDRQVNTHEDNKTLGQVDRTINRETGRQLERKIVIQTDRIKARKIDRMTT